MNAAINWDWVKKELLLRERVPSDKGDICLAVDVSIEKAKTLASPRVVSAIKRILKIGPDFLEIEGGYKFSGKRISSFLKAAGRVHLFLATIGGELENEASSLMSQSENLAGYLMDRAGSFAVESLAESVEEGLRKEYEAKGLTISMRLSPGYCDWPVEEQLVLSKILDFPRAGVTLNEACMMSPKKSISAMVGIGPKGAFSKTKSQCVICNKPDCDYRRVS